MIEAKQAVAMAKAHVLELLSDERPQNIGLEEIEFDERSQRWLITVGFSRPWNQNALNVLAGTSVHRTFRTVALKADTGEFVSMKVRETGKS